MKKLFFSILPVMLVAALFMTSAYAAGPDGAVPYAAGASLYTIICRKAADGRLSA